MTWPMTWPMTWYTGDPTYDSVLTLSYGLVVLVFFGAAFAKSPYGRFASDTSLAQYFARHV